MMAVRPCYRSDVSFVEVLAQVQDERQRDENETAMQEVLKKAEEFNAILNR